MMIHPLKIEQQYLDNLLSGKKKSEIRFNDRDYQVGDVLNFRKYYLDRDIEEIFFMITHIHAGLGLLPNYVVLSVEKTIKPKEPK